MTPGQINVAIAKVRGWTVSQHGWWSHPTLPDNDLNACAAMEATLTDEERREYVQYLASICAEFPKCNPFNEAEFTTFATAPQRCEAFRRVKGLRTE